jgi:hypothetical protein
MPPKRNPELEPDAPDWSQEQRSDDLLLSQLKERKDKNVPTKIIDQIKETPMREVVDPDAPVVDPDTDDNDNDETEGEKYDGGPIPTEPAVDPVTGEPIENDDDSAA